jgi:hypothetical protein
VCEGEEWNASYIVDRLLVSGRRSQKEKRKEKENERKRKRRKNDADNNSARA